MADFVQSANVKSAIRTPAEPNADIAMFNMTWGEVTSSSIILNGRFFRIFDMDD